MVMFFDFFESAAYFLHFVEGEEYRGEGEALETEVGEEADFPAVAFLVVEFHNMEV